MSPFDEVILRVVSEISRRNGRPARTLAVAAHLGKKERVTRHHLHKLESMGLIARTRGTKSGWARTDFADWLLIRRQPHSMRGLLSAA